MKKNEKCIYCGCKFSPDRPKTRDHLIPKARGGTDSPENIGYACRQCNAEKGTMTVAEYRAHRRGEAFYDADYPAPLQLPNDPVERIIFDALQAAGIQFVGENDPRAKRLDFYLPEMDLHIEVKRLHSERTAEQIAKSNSIIVIVGLEAARAFAAMISRNIGNNHGR